jgi:hypothetical protein
MKCFFCNTEITEEHVSVQRVCHEAVINKLDKTLKEHEPIVMDMNFCSRECAIAENIMFNVGLELSKNMYVNEAASKYDEEAVKILSESFDKLREKVINECNCTEEEFDDAETRLFKVMGKRIDVIDPKLRKYL